MTREEKIEIFTMRLDGEELESIAKKKGVSKQRIHAMLNSTINSKKSKPRSTYPVLNEWMFSNNVRPAGISRMLKLSPSTTSNKLNGVSQLKLNEISRLVEITGIEASKLFSKECNQ